MAEREGFEPPLGYYPKPTFQAGAFDRSAISPIISRLFIYSLYEISHRSLYTQNISMCQFLCQLELRVIYQPSDTLGTIKDVVIFFKF